MCQNLGPEMGQAMGHCHLGLGTPATFLLAPPGLCHLLAAPSETYVGVGSLLGTQC